jgi:uncharacterized protein YaiI (UPF0178 family)
VNATLTAQLAVERIMDRVRVTATAQDGRQVTLDMDRLEFLAFLDEGWQKAEEVPA